MSVILVFTHLFIPSQASVEHLCPPRCHPSIAVLGKEGLARWMADWLGKDSWKKDGPRFHVSKVLMV